MRYFICGLLSFIAGGVVMTILMPQFYINKEEQ